MENRPVFFDSGGRRRIVLSRLAGLAGVALTLILVVFAISLTSVPVLGERFAPTRRPHSNHRPPEKPRIVGSDFRAARHALFADIAKSSKKPPLIPRGGNVVAAFYASWQESGTNSLRSYGSHLTHVIPSWLHLSQDGSKLDLEDYDFEENPHNAEVEALARQNGIRIMPMLTNSVNGPFDPQRAHELLSSPAKIAQLAKDIKDWLLQHSYQGLNVDLENLKDTDEALMPDFLRALSAEFHPHNLALSVDVESSTDPDVMAEEAKVADWLVLMAYDEHAETTAPGPIASLDWAEKVLDRTLNSVPADKLVLGIGSYAYDWEAGKEAQSLTYQDALAAAAGFRDGETPEKVIDFDDASLNATFSYEDEDEKGKTANHEVWMLDAASAYNQWQGVRDRHLRGAGLWALGMEDPGVWSFLNRTHPNADPDLTSIRTVQFPYGVDHTGKGEILKVVQQPTTGKRTLEIDPQDRIVTDEIYQQYPFPYVIQHTGYSDQTKKELALTFDDGPDSEYTPMVLDTLKKLGVNATFFVVGQNVETNPGLVQRIYNEGNEIGSHTFTHPDLGAVSPRRASLEINATQRAIQSVLGRSTVLFRPPFNADSEPQTANDVEPIVLADRMGYVTVGEKIDPQDWDLDMFDSKGIERQKTADDIAKSVIAQVADSTRKGQEGNVILLHDAGGPRIETVKALRQFVPQLQKMGYKFVTVSQLMGRNRDSVMPPVSTRERVAIWFDGLIMGGATSLDSWLGLGFVAAIVLGLLRYLFVLPLALVNAKREKGRAAAIVPIPGMPVAVLIAAYNEEKVIVRTIQSVLESDYPIQAIYVVDDGSSDHTAEQVETHFKDVENVILVRQENAGKASALNRAMSMCDAEVVVCIDADTQLDHAAIGHLVHHFENEEVAAVAGNVRVGNHVNILTEWQALEYTTSQNLDRRAYSALNAITVIPGALGAWRRLAVLNAGGYKPDTLAEDMDLTWRLRCNGYRLLNEPHAIAYTEAPDRFGSFFRQRFRWAYGTLQCLAKHRSAIGRHSWFGVLALPTLWLFQIVFQALAPLIDLQVAYSLVSWFLGRLAARSESAHLEASASAPMLQVLALYGIFLAVELIGGFVAYRLDGQSPKPLRWLFLQRFAYRQVMYGVVCKSLLRALAGGRETWGKIERKGTVQRAAKNEAR